MKNKFKIFGATLMTSVLPIATVVSCSGESAPRIVLSLSGPNSTDNDQGFNEQARDAINEYLKANKDDEKNIYNKFEEADVVNPTSEGPNDIKQTYANAPDKSMIVAIGFQHAPALEASKEEIQGKRVILIDTSTASPISNVAAVEYHGEQAGYIGGYTLAKYAATQVGFDKLKNGNKGAGNDSNKVQISAFAGSVMPSVAGVTGGFEFGVNDALNEIKSDTTNFPQADKVEFTYLGNQDKHITNFKPGGGDDTIAEMETKGVDVLFPFAGPQTDDALTNYTGLIVGADAPQEKKYPDKKERFLFSVLKDVKTSVSNMIKKLEGKTIDKYPEAYLGLGKTTWGTLENELVGISDFTPKITEFANKFRETASLMERVKKLDTSKFITDKDGKKVYEKEWYNK